jgi:hypothetical protein
MPRSSLRLIDYSDRELLHMVEDLAGPDGWADALDLAKALGIEGKRRAACVGSRLAWLRRYGAVEGERGPVRMRWQVTEIGHVMIRGELRSRVRNVLEDLDESQVLLVMRALAGRQRSYNNDVRGHLIRREWRHSSYS